MQDKNAKSIVLKESTIGVIKGLIGAIPICGAAINEAVFDIAGRIQQKRINDFVIQLSDQLNDTSNNKIDQDYLRSEEFYDLTRMIFESVIKTKAKEKQAALSKVYINAILEKSDMEQDSSSLFSKFIIELLPLQVKILIFIEKNEAELVEIATYNKLYDMFIESHKIAELDKYEFKYFCNDLDNKGLISMGAGLEDYYSTSSFLAFEDHKEASIKLTSLGKKFIEFLE